MEFNIPANVEDLITDAYGYRVKDVVGAKHVASSLKDMRKCLRDNGVEFILDNFDVFYSILRHSESLKVDVIFTGYEIIEKAFNDLIKSIKFLLDDKDSINEELRTKYLAIIKMLVYLYTQIVLLVEQKNTSTARASLKSKKKSNTEEPYQLNKKNIVLNFINLLLLDINIFWDPPAVEDNIINITSDVCYQFLQDPTIKSQKDLIVELFSFFGLLIKNFNHTTTFIVRLVQLIKICEHLLHCLPDGIKHLVETYNAKSLVHSLIQEVTEWQTDEQFQDGQGARNCSQILTKLAAKMPELMISELMSLDKYLSSDSAPLRSSVLNVITEVLLNVLANCKLNEEQEESRETFLSILKDHVRDSTPSVRAKTMQNIAKLQKENIIPVKTQNEMLQQIVPHFFDKFAVVRKAAVNCVETFLSHNLYGSNLSRKEVKTELDEYEASYKKVMLQLHGIEANKLEEMQEKWDVIKKHLVPIIEEEIQAEEDEDKENAKTDLPKNVVEQIKKNLNEGRYKEAFKLNKIAFAHIDEWKNFRQENNSEDEVTMYLLMMQSIYCNMPKIVEQLRDAKRDLKELNLSEDDVKRIEKLRDRVDFLHDCIDFLDLIDSCIEPAGELLESETIGDMHEAIAFFVSAYQFNLDNAHKGILSMLRMMQRNEQDRKEPVLKAFKTIFMGLDTDNSSESRTVAIVNQLISFLKTIPLNSVDHFEAIIVELVSNGTISNQIIDTLWQYYTKRVQIGEDDVIAAAELLRMAATARRTIITKNIKLVSTIAFFERKENKCMRFLASSCALLAVAGQEKIDITGNTAPTRIKYDDVMFQELTRILVDHFFQRDDYYTKALQNAIRFIYAQSNKPERNCEELVKCIIKKLSVSDKTEIEKYLLIRLCQLMGFVAINFLEYMDETVYKELKRRTNAYDKRNKKPKNGQNSSVVSGKSKSKRVSVLKEDGAETLNESTLEGAQAQDADAEFILDILENHIITSSGCGVLADILIDICSRPDIYNDEMVQNVAVVALIRFMLISSVFCQQHLQLLFTILERTKFINVKASVLVHLSDLLTRFPNAVEPWTKQIYSTLYHPSEEVRKIAYFILSNLILREMVRAHSRISELACGLVDESDAIKRLSESFFLQLSHQENSLSNVLPDIFTYLLTVDRINGEQLRYIMKFLFEHIDKTKQMESLVDRFCWKFRMTDNIEEQRHIAYCLTLIQYNEKALRKLQENFSTYKDLMFDGAIYAAFNEIFDACNKQQVGKVDLKPIVQEIESRIQATFDGNNEGDGFVKPKVPGGKKGSRSKVPKTKKKKQQSDSEDEEDVDMESVAEEQNSSRRSERRRNQVRV